MRVLLELFVVAFGLLSLSSRSTAFSTGSARAGRFRSVLGGYLDSLSTGETFAPSATASPAPISPAASAASTEFDYVPKLGLSQADLIANNIVDCCKRNGFNPVTVQVLDASGSSLVSKRMDGCSPVGIPDMAKAKAFGCIVNKYPSRAFRDRYTSDETSAKFCQLLTMVDISQGQMAPFPGGILLKLNDHVIGAVGVSGAAGDEDEYCAIRGVLEANLGLTVVPETHSCSTVKDIF
uniref:Heme-binding protein n=1 Tax=Odontella aurita TaxID=265563 RepID=A0A7S4MWI6_9STRA|mmetsp:Transcript_36969/g.110730  ORF Transcript_36969/g.110730 Transcript_36969/m.110730 type:complete len:237 (+) Transcript_36969:48-758(+)